MAAGVKAAATDGSVRPIPGRVLIIWLVLVALTVANPLLGTGEASGGTDSEILATAILTIAVVKVRFVGLDFMELRAAPRPMRLVFEAYCLILWAVLVACFLWL